MNKEIIQKAEEWDACSDALEWMREQPEDADLWETCPRGDRLLWWAEKCGVDKKLLALAGCACARTALKYVPEGEDRPRIAIETTEAWARGEATQDEVYAAAWDAEAAASAAAEAAASVAWASAWATNAAWASAWAAWDAASVAEGTAGAAAHKEHADIVRKMIPRPVWR